MKRTGRAGRYAWLAALVFVLGMVVAATASLTAAAGQDGWLIDRRDNDYHFVEAWSDYLHDDDPATTYETGPHAVNPTPCQWNVDEDVRNTWSNGTLAPGESVSFIECVLSDGYTRSSQAAAYARQGVPMQVTIEVSNQFHSRTSTRLGETCIMGPAYPHMMWFDHTNPYGAWIEGSNVTPDHTLVDDGGWAVGPTTITVTVTNTGARTAREVGISSLIGRTYGPVPQPTPAACLGLTVTPSSGYEPKWYS